MSELQRGVSLSEAGQELAQDRLVVDLLGSIRESEYTPAVDLVSDLRGRILDEPDDDLYSEFLGSEAFGDFDQADKDYSRRAISIVDPRRDPTPYWIVEGSAPGDDMFTLNSIVRRIQVVRADTVLLSGISSLDIQDSMPEAWEGMGRLGFTSRVDFANFVGAAYLDKYTFVPFKGFTLTQNVEDGVTEEVLVGGDLNGDFRMLKTETYPQGAIDPLGRLREFAPKGNEVVLAAYHSTEPDILYNTLRHLNAIGLSVQAQTKIIQDAVLEFMDWLRPANEAERTNPFVVPFADYGTQDDEFWSRKTHHYFGNMANQRVYQGDGQVIDWDALGVIPGETVEGFNISTRGNDLVFGNGIFDAAGAENYKEIVIKPDSIGDFIVALLKQANVAAGRTSPRTLIAILTARYMG